MNKVYKHELSDDNQEGVMLNGTQVWRPSIPMPYYVGLGLKKSRCACGQVFKTDQAYKAHYIYQAVWENESGYIPSLLAKGKGL